MPCGCAHALGATADATAVPVGASRKASPMKAALLGASAVNSGLAQAGASRLWWLPIAAVGVVGIYLLTRRA